MSADPATNDRGQARQIADQYIWASLEGGDVARARTAVATAPRVISDLMAEYYAAQIRAGNEQIAWVLGNQVEPMWFASGRDLLVAALRERSGNELTIHCLAHGPVRRDVESAGLLRRIASSYVRPWVIGFVGIPVLFGVFGALAAKTPINLVVWACVVGVLLLILLIDARLRRCPACARFLAGMLVGLKDGGSYTESVQVETAHGPETVQRQARSYISLWVCVHCRYRWER